MRRLNPRKLPIALALFAGLQILASTVLAQVVLNKPDESMNPSPIACHQPIGTPPADSASTKQLVQILSDSSVPGARAANVAAALRGVSTFEALESRACPMIRARFVGNAEHYAAFVDTIVPLLLQSTPMQLPPSAIPQLISPASGQAFSHYPRKTTVAWHPVSGADHYLLEVQVLMHLPVQGKGLRDLWVAHNDGLHSASVRDTSAIFYFIGANEGRWRVRTIGPGGQSSGPSEWRAFSYNR